MRTNDSIFLGSALPEMLDGTLVIQQNKRLLFLSLLSTLIDIIVYGASPLSLPDAAANSLQYVKAFGGTEQRNLPAGYTQVEYLESTGTQYIDTGAVLKSEATITMVAQASSVAGSGPSAFWGFMGSDTMPRWGWSVYNNSWLTDINKTNIVSVADTQKHTFVNSCFYTGTDLQYNSSVDGNNLFSSAQTIPQVETYTNNTLSAYLFARDNNGTAGNFLACKIFSFEVVQDGVKILSVVPARRNSDNVLGMYDTVSGQFLTNAGTGTFTAGADVVPTPDTPVDIVSNNGVLRYGQYGKNLFDATNMTKTSGTIPSAYMVEFTVNSANLPVIELESGVTYTLSFDIETNALPFGISVGCGVGNYVKDVQQTGTIFTDSGRVFVTFTPTDVDLAYGNIFAFRAPRYQQLTNFTYSISNIQLERGSTATPYEPYHVGVYADGTVETINVHGKNLLSPTMIHQGTINGATGEILNAPNRCYTDAIKFKTGDNICITVDADSPSLYSSAFLYTSADDVDFWRGLSAAETITADNRTGYRFVVPRDCYVRFLFLQTAHFTPADVTNPQLERGSTATAYEPYYNGGTATAEMLLKVGDYTDEQEILSGAVTRKVGVKVLDGSESWGDLPAYNGFSLALTDAIVGEKNPVVSTHEKQSTTFLQEGMILGGGAGNNVLYWTQIYSVIANNLTDFKQWLADQYAAGTPVIIVYPLETPTTESVAGQALQVQAGDNVVEITQASIDNLELEAQYKKSA